MDTTFSFYLCYIDHKYINISSWLVLAMVPSSKKNQNLLKLIILYFNPYNKVLYLWIMEVEPPCPG